MSTLEIFERQLEAGPFDEGPSFALIFLRCHEAPATQVRNDCELLLNELVGVLDRRRAKGRTESVVHEGAKNRHEKDETPG
jgi:hypothetical protein